MAVASDTAINANRLSRLLRSIACCMNPPGFEWMLFVLFIVSTIINIA